MGRLLLIFCLLGTALSSHGQQLRNPVPASYNPDMQRLLVLATANYVYAICQGQMDRDSATLFSASAFGLSRLTAYNEDFSTGKNYPGQQLIDAGRISEAVHQLSVLHGDPQLQLLAELGIYFLHNPSGNTADIDSATVFIESLHRSANASQDKRWFPRSLRLLGTLSAKKNNAAESQRYFEQAVAFCRKIKDAKMLALSLIEAAGYLPPGDARIETYLQDALDICRKENLSLLQYRVMFTLLLEHTHTHPERVITELPAALDFEKQIGFLHHQYAYCSLSYWYTALGDLVNAKLNAEHAIESMESTKDTVLSTVYCMRMTEIYFNMQRNLPLAIYWNTRALSVPKTRQTQVFWYKNIFIKIQILLSQHLYAEALQLAEDVSRRYPPSSDFNEMHMAYNIGRCYEALHQDEQALTQYRRFLDIAARYPPQFTYTEALLSYYQIAIFYIRKGNYAFARKYAMKILNHPIGKHSAPNQGMANYLLFKADSAQGNYTSAIQHYQQYHRFADSTYSISQRKKMDELTVQYETKKKDQDIRILKQNTQLQKERIARSAMISNATLSGIIVLLVIVSLLYNQYRVKQKVNKETLAKNKTLHRVVEEKEWLLREVHHRVKNNLQTIVSLLESQSIYLQNEALQAIQESQNRIYAMSLIHQKLYHNENISSVNIADYLPELVQYLCDSYNVRSRITWTLNLQGIELDVSQAIPIGLIVNEAITNAIKYAFPQPQSGDSISICFSLEKNIYAKLLIADNGIGIAPEIINSKIQGLGLKLIRGLAKDISADVELHADNGTSITMAFEVSRPLKTVMENSTSPIVNAAL
jgi:two-component sensor histidine kinase